MVLFIAIPQFLIIFDLNCFFIMGRNSTLSLELILNSLNSLISFEPKADNVAAPSAVASCSLDLLSLFHKYQKDSVKTIDYLSFHHQLNTLKRFFK